METLSQVTKLIGYSFLVIFANDDAISEDELHMLEKIALEDHQIDDEERSVLSRIFARADPQAMTPQVWEEIQQFKDAYQIP